MKCPARRYGCQHYCVHLPDGGHRCMCHHGYSLAPNGRHCEGMNEKFLLNVSKYLKILNKERNLCLSCHPFFDSFITISRISKARHRYI